MRLKLDTTVTKDRMRTISQRSAQHENEIPQPTEWLGYVGETLRRLAWKKFPQPTEWLGYVGETLRRLAWKKFPQPTEWLGYVGETLRRLARRKTKLAQPRAMCR